MLSDHFANRQLTSAELEGFQQNGYCHLAGLLKPAGIEQMLKECMDAWAEEKGPYDPNSTWLKNALLVDIHHKSKLVRDYYFEGPLVEIANQIKGATSQLTLKMRGNTSVFGWHQDNGYGELAPYNATTCLAALEDNNAETGCLWVLPGSHKQGQIQTRCNAEDREKLGEVVVDVDESQAIPVPMKAGDCLLLGCWTLHKSEGNFSEDQDRRVLFLRYADADAVEVYNDNRPRLGRLLSGSTIFPEVATFESEL
ncbi:phytanoyl-CoA dioxygenase family protein [Planctomycetes bacterium K23_9]|uniref:Phytanoyl-CoA dioxygenase (PhyH) n=1 Tax=Stieleria marina TaxID=1930275 RepID=A0A517NRU2_9BACT|nr:Phytanoyl-CoA dioxygenase (PhyH) [Planctomycetes bacterium K23_9]